MALMGDGDLRYVRAQAEDALPDTVTVQRIQQTPDGQGGYTAEVLDAYQDVPARLTPASQLSAMGMERLLGERVNVVADWVLTVPWDQEVRESDRVVHEGRAYEVVFVAKGASYQTAKRCLLRRMG